MSKIIRPYRKVAVSGGPMSGKTTGQNFTSEKLGDYGWLPIFVPEVATLIIGCGLNPKKLSPEQYRKFQGLIFKTQIKFEDEIFSEAVDIRGGDKKVMLCDRGLLDGKAYMDPEMFADILKENNMTEEEAYDRYEGAFHLVTVADGKPELYSTKNNPSRVEKTPEEAVEADQKTQNAWLGHRHLRVIDNSTDFDQKLNRLLNEIRRLLGDPVAIETERAFLVCGGFRLKDIPVPFKKVNIEQIYLAGPEGMESRLRRRNQEDSGSVYYQTQKLPNISPASRPENEWQITAEEYMRQLTHASPNHDIVRKIRICFLYKHQYFELDIFLEPKRLFGLVRLEIELTEDNDKVEVPDWLGKVEEVTGDPKWSNYALARRW